MTSPAVSLVSVASVLSVHDEAWNSLPDALRARLTHASRLAGSALERAALDAINLEHHKYMVLSYDSDAILQVEFSAVDSSDVYDEVFDVLTDDMNQDVVERMGRAYPLFLFGSFVQKMTNRSVDNLDESAMAAWRALVSKVQDVELVATALFERRRADGLVEAEHIYRLFPVGSEVVSIAGEDSRGGVVSNVQVVRTFFSSYVAIEIECVEALRGRPENAVYECKIPLFSGTRPIADLPVIPVTEELKEQLTERGRVFRATLGMGSYWSYQGLLFQNSWMGSRTYRADGRVVVDSKSFSRMESSVFRDEMGMANLSFSDDSSMHVMDVPDVDLWRCSPYVYGFSMAAKRWGRLSVAQLSPIQWRDDAFSRVVMDEEKKQMVLSLVQHSGHDFCDLIDGKGGGCIFLLHGDPGLGKTLISESVAEVLHRPLYSVSVGELGTTPERLEDRLRQILDVATIWNAVILLDEADIFLESRDERDVQRNAMVGVFLRLLEYHNGVLFLTTNRVRNIDRAFFSRISVALSFDPADAAKRTQIWASLLGASNLDTSWAERLGVHDVNGRQIKNAIRIARTLARAKERAPVIEDVESVLNMTLSFAAQAAQSFTALPPAESAV